MKKQTNRLAFTLIELLVVITIIGILATGAVSVYTSQIQKARDATRINDVKALQSGIEQFYQDNATYPIGVTEWTSTTNWVMVYTPGLAEDLKHNETCNGSRCWYVYIVWDDDNWINYWAYEISTAFENQWNVDSKANNNWNDPYRYETWLRTEVLVTASEQATAFTRAAANDTTNPVVIEKSSVVTK